MTRRKKPPREHQFGLPLSGFEWKPSTPPTEDSITFDEARRWAKAKRRLKFSRRLPRKLLAEFVRTLVRGE